MCSGGDVDQFARRLEHFLNTSMTRSRLRGVNINVFNPRRRRCLAVAYRSPPADGVQALTSGFNPGTGLGGDSSSIASGQCAKGVPQTQKSAP